jgi:deazaflavin-dependent oxidoreductase (nitroreductase family)
MTSDGLARLARLPTRVPRLQHAVGRLHARVLRASGGRMRRSRLLAGGQPVLALTTTGRRSGEPRTTLIAHLPVEDGWAVFGMNLGSERDPAWALNLAATPEAEIHVDGRTLPVVARPARGAEAAALWERYVRRLPAAERFAALSGRTIPVFVLEPRDTAGKVQ